MLTPGVRIQQDAGKGKGLLHLFIYYCFFSCKSEWSHKPTGQRKAIYIKSNVCQVSELKFSNNAGMILGYSGMAGWGVNPDSIMYTLGLNLNTDMDIMITTQIQVEI